ncbi:hypothetical protein Bca4012_075470 [Brassica carinata]
MVTTKRLNTNNLCHLVWSLVAHHKLKAELSSVLCHDKASTNGVSFTSLCNEGTSGQGVVNLALGELYPQALTKLLDFVLFTAKQTPNLPNPGEIFDFVVWVGSEFS